MGLTTQEMNSNSRLRSNLEVLRSQLEVEQSSFRNHWADLSCMVSPRSARFFITDTNKGEKVNDNIIDSTATMALNTMASGMMTGITSPARPWFKLDLEDKKLEKSSATMEWLSEVEMRMRDVFLKSNLYTNLPMLFKSVGLYSTGCMYMEEDFESVVRFRTFPVGSYFLGNDEKLRTRIFHREFQMTVRQIVEKFGYEPDQEKVEKNINWDNISGTVKTQYEAKSYEQWHGVVHFIIPNPDYNPRKLESKHKKFLSVYYERGGATGSGSNINVSPNADTGKILRKKGYDFFPVMAARWSKESEDIYGTDGPGMTALGDIKQLQHGELRTAEAIDKQINPPLKGPTSLQRKKVSLIPGHITYVDERDSNRGLSSIYDLRFDIASMENKQAQVRERINDAFFVNLFMMISRSDRREITATEIDARQEEKLLVLGPVLERLNDDVLDPLIDNTFQIMLRQGLIPDPPPEIQGEELKVEYISIMAQAQKLAGVGAIERYASFVGQMAGLDQSALHKLDTDAAIDEYAELVGAPQSVRRDKEEVKEIRDREAEQAAQAAQQQNVRDSIEAAKNLSETSTDSGNALTELVARQQGA